MRHIILYYIILTHSYFPLFEFIFLNQANYFYHGRNLYEISLQEVSIWSIMFPH